MLVAWVSGLAVSERLYKGIQKGGGNKIKKKQKQKKTKKQTNNRYFRYLPCDVTAELIVGSPITDSRGKPEVVSGRRFVTRWYLIIYGWPLVYSRSQTFISGFRHFFVISYASRHLAEKKDTSLTQIYQRKVRLFIIKVFILIGLLTQDTQVSRI